MLEKNGEFHPDDSRIPDIVACSSSLSNLFRVIKEREGPEWPELPPFRAVLELVGGGRNGHDGTVFITRRENSPFQTMAFQGYGQAFPRAYTTWERDVEGSRSHQRVMSYCFAGLKIMIRFECDGYLGESPSETSPSASTKVIKTDTMDDLITGLAKTSLGSGSDRSEAGGKLIVKDKSKTAKLVSQSQVFNLKTRSILKCPDPPPGALVPEDKHRPEDTLAIEMRRMWLTQIPNFVLAYHQAGTFNDIRVRRADDIWPKVLEWEEEHRAGQLARFGALLHAIVDAVRKAAAEGVDRRIEVMRRSREMRDKEEEQENAKQSSGSGKEPSGGVNRVHVAPKTQQYGSPKNASGPLEIRKALPDAPRALSERVEAQWLRFWMRDSASAGDGACHADGHVIQKSAASSDPDSPAKDWGQKPPDIDDLFEWSGAEEKVDYTACSQACGYCGKCA